MCFLPNSRASTDHAPGPIMANVALSVATMIGILESPVRQRKSQISVTLVSVPTTGVHKPTKMNIDRPAPISSGRAADLAPFAM
jgi:hypothetical protein